jgi:hypothetical protein
MSVNVYANSAFDVANSASSYANSGFSTANTANSIVNSKVTVNSLTFLSAPSANTQNTIFLVVDLDTGTPTTKKMSLSVLTDRSANSAGVYANSAFLTANTPNHVANSAASYANSAFLTANTPSHVANSAASYANSAFSTANVASSYANSAFLTANTPNHVANSASSYANGAFTSANASSNLALSFSSTTILEVTNSGSAYYIFSQYDSLQNPNVSTFSATTLGFKLNVSGHPFHIRLGDNTADYNTGLVHVDTTGTLSYGSSAQGKVSGTLFWRIPHNAVGNYKYRCVNNTSVMIGDINVANTAAVYFAYSS